MRDENAVHVLQDRLPDCFKMVLTFRLVYQGPLPPRTWGNADIRHGIRKQLHPQVRRLWQRHPILSQFFQDAHGTSSTDYRQRRIKELADKFGRNGYRFVPLLRKEIGFMCSLDVLLMRRGNYTVLEQGKGDLDNRVKSLIDGLRMVHQLDETGGMSPSPDEDPFFCLLEDDSLVAELRVRTDTLLTPDLDAAPENDVLAVIKVEVMSPSGRFDADEFFS